MDTQTNKDIMSRNIKRYMEQKGVSNQQICDALGFKYTTFLDWIKAKTYPRIGKIEAMANYFGCEKSDLIEEKPTTAQDDGQREDVKQFVEFLNGCSEEEVKALSAMSQAFLANLRAGSFAPPEEDLKKKQ